MSLGLDSLHHTTMFDKDDNQDDDSAPGAFKSPEIAIARALEDLDSPSWQDQVAALAALVRVARWNTDLILPQVMMMMMMLMNSSSHSSVTSWIMSRTN